MCDAASPQRCHPGAAAFRPTLDITASFQRTDGRSLHVRKATRPETELAEIYQALNLNPLPGGVQKTIV